MTASDSEVRADEQERDNLQKAISEVETVLTVSTSAGTRAHYENFLHNARGRIASLDKKIKESQTEMEQRARDVVAVAYAAEKETALSEREKETYSGFLKEAYFTKTDFDRLEKFYSQTWNRLSDGGKDEMSKRVWEGVRRDEYKFTDLPKVVQEKEAERAYEVLKKREAGVGMASQIPEGDRDDFIRAHESGNPERACEVLDRKSFRENMFLGTRSKEKKSITVTDGKVSAGDRVEVQASTAAEHDPVPPKAGGSGDLNISDLKLGSVTLADAPPVVSSADIPTAKTALKGGPSLGSS